MTGQKYLVLTRRIPNNVNGAPRYAVNVIKIPSAGNPRDVTHEFETQVHRYSKAHRGLVVVTYAGPVGCIDHHWRFHDPAGVPVDYVELH